MEKITWEFSEPDEFPCMSCGQNRAEWKGQFRHRGVTVNLCLCDLCANLPEIELMKRVFGEVKAC